MSCNPCNPCCDDQVVENIPGPQGPDGANGADGADGINAFTLTTAGFTQPAVNGNVTVQVEDSTWMTPFQIVYVQTGGHYEVQSKPNDTSVILENLGYPGNAAPATVIAGSMRVSPAGLRGPDGADGTSGAPDDAKYVLVEADGALTNAQALDGLGTGVVTFADGTNMIDVKALGIADGNIAPVDEAVDTTMTAGEAVFATSSGIESKTAGNARTALGLGTASTRTAGNADTNVPFVNDAAGLTNGEALFATATGVESKTNVNARSALNINRTLQDILIYRHEEAANTGGGDFNNGARRIVPLNTEVTDTGGHGSIAGNTITLAQGVYRARWSVKAYRVDGFHTYLYNVTTAATVGLGTNGWAENAASATMGVSYGEARITIAGATEQIRLEAECQTTHAANGFGIPVNLSGEQEIYSYLTLEREVG